MVIKRNWMSVPNLQLAKGGVKLVVQLTVAVLVNARHELRAGPGRPSGLKLRVGNAMPQE